MKTTQIVVERPHTCLAVGSDLNSNMLTNINTAYASVMTSALPTSKPHATN